MIVSDAHKFIFLAVPHTGSSTLQTHLRKYGWSSPVDAYGNHLSADRARGHFMVMGNVKWNSYLKACFIRNPWDRYVALCIFANATHKLWNIPNYGMFANYISSGGYEGMHQDEFLLHRDGKYAMDFVGRFENIVEDTRLLFEKIGLPVPEDLHRIHANNTGTQHCVGGVRKHYTAYYTEQWMIDAVAEREKFVIDRFGYKYGEDGSRWL